MRPTTARSDKSQKYTFAPGAFKKLEEPGRGAEVKAFARSWYLYMSCFCGSCHSPLYATVEFFLTEKTRVQLWRPQGKITSALNYCSDAIFLG